jgi:hypothetical protein
MGKFCYRTFFVGICCGKLGKNYWLQDTRQCPAAKKLACYSKENTFLCPTANFMKEQCPVAKFPSIRTKQEQQ